MFEGLSLRVCAFTCACLVVCVAGSRAAASPAARCGAPATRIHAVQGAGASSPLRGEIVEAEGVVVGAFDGLGGFYVQEEDLETDADPRTSEGIFVFDPGSRFAPRPGETVRVRGEVREFFGQTELGGLEGIWRCRGRGTARPAVVHLPVDDARDWERWEGMRVLVAQPLTVSGAHGLGRFGELVLAAGGRLWQPTHRVAPGAPARSLAEADARRRLVLDDGSDAPWPRPLPHAFRADGAPLRLGDRVEALEGVVGFAWGAFRIHPTEAVRIHRRGSPEAGPPTLPGRMRIAAWNVGNFFNGDGSGGGFPTRGAADPEELGRQRAKLVATLAALDADVLALVEVENDGTGRGSAVRELAETLGRASGARWAVADPGDGALGRSPISVALLHRPDRVQPIGAVAVLGEGVHPDFDATRHRPVLARSFRHRTSGGSLTLAVAHLKSKGSACPGDPDTGDGQGECSGTRRRAAEAIVTWLAGEPTGTGAPPLVVGDLNAYPQEDALAVLADAGYVDLLAWFAGPDAHSYVFDGAAGRLDHALAAAPLLADVAGAASWNTNSDAPPVLDYRLENPPELYRSDPVRASDHDPVLVGLFPEPRPVRSPGR